MTRNKSEDSQHPLARRLAPAILLAGGGVAFLAMVDGPQEGISTAALNTVAPTDTTALADQTTLPSGTSDSTTTTAGSNVCGVSRSTGAQVEFRWGIVQVEAFLDGAGELCEVNVLQFPDADRRSVAINNYALPILHTEAVAAKNANIQAVSGATLTSRAYMASLQYALDNA